MDQTFEIDQVVDGQYERRQMTVAQLMAERSASKKKLLPEPTKPKAAPQLGLLSRTIVPSPTINHIIPVRIRHQNKNDLVYVGEDFLRLHEIQDDGSLDFVVGREGLPRIRAAKAFGQPWQQLSDVQIKLENGMSPDIDTVWEKESTAFSESSSNASQANFPPQLLLLALETQELLFVYTQSDENNRVSFHAQSIALMSGKSILEHPGNQIAVDPRSRAIAVAASEKNVVIYSTNPPQDMQGSSKMTSFIQSEAIEQVPGVILKMDFLFPAEQDNDHIALLIIHSHNSRVYITCFDWIASIGLTSRQRRLKALPLVECQEYPLLLITLQFSPDCMIVTEDGIYYFQKILAGADKVKKVFDSHDPVISKHLHKRPPLWTSWTRVERAHRFHNRVQEDFYLVREDGQFFYMEVKSKETYCGMSYAGSFGCNVDTAFTNLPLGLRKPDHVVAAGIGGHGGILRIGMSGKVAEVPRREKVFQPDLVGQLPSWAPTMDLVEDTCNTQSQGTFPHGIVVTSGRAPRGCVSSLRSGLSANIRAQIGADMDVANCIGGYLLSTPESDQIVFLLSFPTHSDLIRLSVVEEAGEEVLDVQVGLSEAQEDNVGLDLGLETLFASSIGSDRAIQVTRRGAIITEALTLRETARLSLSPDSAISVATLEGNYLVYAYMSVDSGGVRLAVTTFNRELDILTGSEHHFDLSSEPTCVKFITIAEKVVLAVSTHAHELLFFDLPSSSSNLRLLSAHRLPKDKGSSATCESLAVLHSEPCTDLLVCGLRSGHVLSFEVDVDSPVFDPSFVAVEGINHPVLRVSSVRELTVGPTSVRLFDTPIGLFMTCNNIFCRIDRLTRHNALLEVRTLLFEDVYQDNLRPFPIYTTLYLPRNMLFAGEGLSESLLCVSEGELLSTVPDESSAVIPKRLPIDGTPYRMIVDDEHYLALTRKTEWRNGLHASSKTRCCLEVIDPRRYTTQEETEFEGVLASFQLPRKEKANCLATWKPHCGMFKYNWIAIGTTASLREPSPGMRSASGQAGGLLIVRKVPSARGALGQKGGLELRKVKYIYYGKSDEGPIHALASYRNDSLIIGTGQSLHILQYDQEAQSFNTVFRYRSLPSPAVRIEVKPHRYEPDRHMRGDPCYVTTLKHSVLGFDMHVGHANMWPGIAANIEPTFTDTTHRQSITHHLIAINSPKPSHSEYSPSAPVPSAPKLLLVADKSATVTGLLSDASSSRQTALRVAFSARLPRSITRMRSVKVLPPWNAQPLDGIEPEPVIGSAADGTLFALHVLRHHAWQVLKVLECLLVVAASKESASLLCKPDVKEAERAQDVILSIKARKSAEDADTSSVLRPTLRDLDWHVDGTKLAYLRTADIELEINRLVEGAGWEAREAWEMVLGDFMAEMETRSEIEVAGTLEKWLVGVLGPVF
ncbi:hypothetical protein EJ05DRAFT_236408 [Pseudovirgaria hyperparasitica]|uniref:Uncharacterized protein n=1 Tax=Pseudovirgaria hyperparasitica TaxID=470096 RepID=A0A6A6VQG6_9PEZI|nr:uncharacterized protein EJ05DRAFT_236408 [Pseudovirgaria hyperparasitica]KAF2752888.1 hypothetical protein EJ05DRAFT_236408 [Pseudovirgaria hyperparasitica]